MEETLYFGGPILTLEEPRYAQALLVRDGRIAFVGERAAAEGLAGPGTRRVDLEGRALLPAFVDAHSHLLACAYARLQVPLGECASWADILRKLSAHVRDRALPPGEWVKGTGYDPNALKEGAPPDRFCLDAACPQNPVVIQHASGHSGVFSTLALERLGVLEDGSAALERDSGGKLTGRGEEAAFLALLGRVPLEGMEQVLSAFQAAQEEYASHGIATAQEGLLNAALAPAYEEILHRGLLKLDVEAYVPPEEFAGLRERFSALQQTAPGRFRLAGEKIFLDGSPQSRTAWMREPYLGGGGEVGVSAMTDGQVEKAMAQAMDRGVQLLTHCNGDRAAEQYLTVLERVERGRELYRPVLIHAQLLGRDQLEQVKRLHVIPSFFLAHVYHWGEAHMGNLGLERARAISPAGSALKWDIPFTFHQDSPVLPPDMVETLWCACVRRTRAGRVLGPEERVPVEAALRAVTWNGAFQYGMEGEKGSLRAGKRADLVLLSGDPLDTRPEELKNLQVLETVKDGRSIWRR